jgi:hypothetical protein
MNVPKNRGTLTLNIPVPSRGFCSYCNAFSSASKCWDFERFRNEPEVDYRLPGRL